MANSENSFQDFAAVNNSAATDLDVLYDKPMVKTIEFDTGQRILLCKDFLAAPKISFRLPLQILRLLRGSFQLISELLQSSLQVLPQQSKKYDSLRKMHLIRLEAFLKLYEASELFLDSYSGPNYKASILKDNPDYSFVPSNLHIQRFIVLNEDLGPAVIRKYIDCVTCGAFTAYAEGYATGGCRRSGENLKKKLTTLNADNVERFKWWKVTSLCRLLVETRRKLDQLKSIFNSTRWIEMGSDEAEGFALKIDQLRTQLKEICDSESFHSTDVDKFSDSEENLEGQLNDLDAEFACLSTKTENLTSFLQSKISVDKECLAVASDMSISVPTPTKAATSSVLSPIENENVYKSSLHQSTFNVLSSLNKLMTTIQNCFAYQFLSLLNSQEYFTMYYDLAHRKNVILSQALTTVCSALLHKLWTFGEQPDDCLTDQLNAWYHIGLLLTVHSFLSCYKEEKAMIEDLAEALNMISRCKFRLVRSFSNVRNVCQPVVEGSQINDLCISLPASSRLLDAVSKLRPLSDCDGHTPQASAWFNVRPVLLTVGINYEESLARTMGVADLECDINRKAHNDYESYFEAWSRRKKHDNTSNGRTERHDLDTIATNLKLFESHLPAVKSKNVKLFNISRHLNESMNGSLILCCKSGKDRTAMGVTLDQVDFLMENHMLPWDQYQTALDHLRRDGCRLDNTMKNIGNRRYAFTGVQYTFLPQYYKPPKGTYGRTQT